MIKNLVPRTFWFVLAIIAVLTFIEGSNTTKNPYNITPEEVCTFAQQLGTNGKPIHLFRLLQLYALRRVPGFKEYWQ